MERDYLIIGNTLELYINEDKITTNLSDVTDSLVEEIGKPVKVVEGKLKEYTEYTFDCPIDGHGLSGFNWFEIDIEEIEKAVRKNTITPESFQRIEYESFNA